MNESKLAPRWRVCGRTVRGASHARLGKPNQDSIDDRSTTDGLIAVAVADGHGSRKCFRSDRGSKLATAIAVDQLIEFTEELKFEIEESELQNCGFAGILRQKFEIELPQRIVQRWQGAVDENLINDPIAETELATLTDAERASVECERRTAYGTTLIAVLLHADFEVHLQLGDGDILVVRDNENEGQPTRPIPPDERSFANETASLAPPPSTSSKKRPESGVVPWTDFRIRLFARKSTRPPSLVLLTTDGYPNAFLNDVGFQKAATDIVEIHRNEGWEFVKDQLPVWLEEASHQGSGDDVTVALIVQENEAKNTLSDPTVSTDEL